ncbi:Protein of unknown function [Faunimonas pinastri]|uniref:DUF2842 domain-containing protein n=1 Tax=Faunimonas pinastri TaxID=1855383 RepID=A0A1H9CB38_9HYPH|nr:DUF2842 domain-containing protein [Faunimonas pinastri]SEP98372.1 Protein of unknown function [Faunimonas pinastri]
MRQRIRKLTGAAALLVLVVCYALVVMTIAVTRIPDASKLGQLVFYIVAGFLWVLPAGALISWMSKPDQTARRG